MTQKTTLSKMRLIHWMYFEDETIDFKNKSVLVSGSNGAGKSTILDALQMVLTGNSTKFNEAANEKSKRDLRGYIRCKVNTTAETYMRRGAVVSNIALEFYEEKEKRYFTAGVLLISPDETDSVKKRWYIESGKLSDFSFLDDENPLQPSFPEKFKNNGNKIPFIQSVNEYKEKLRHRLGNLEEKFFDVIQKTIAFRPVDDVKEFINKYVLSEREIDVASLRESIDQLNDLEHLLEKTKLERDALEKITKLGEEIEKVLHDKDVNELLLLIANYENTKQKIDEIKNALSVNSAKSSQIEKSLQNLGFKIKDEEEKLLDLRQQRKDSDFSKLIEKLENSIAESEKEKARLEIQKRVLEQNVKNLSDFLKSVSKISDVPFSLSQIDSLTKPENDGEKLSLLEDLRKFAGGQFENANIESVHLQDEIHQKEKQKAETEKRAEELEKQKVTFPSGTESLRRAIENEFSQRGISSKVYVLSELLEITDKTWTNAVEGYLNTQRFYLVVEPEYYNIALEVYSRSKKISSQGIINTRKLPDFEADENSLAQFVQSENRFAKRFVNYVLGKVICVENIFDLEKHDSAITKECMVYKNFVARKINPEIYETPFIGKNAVKIQLASCKKQLDELKAILPELRKKSEILESVKAAHGKVNFDSITQNVSCPADLENLENEIAKNKAELSEIEQNPEFIELEMKIESQEKNLDNLKKQKDKDEREKIRIESDSKDKNAELLNLESQNDVSKNQIDEVSVEKTSVYSEASEKYKTELKSKSAAIIAENFAPRNVALENQNTKLNTNLIEKQTQYNATFSRDLHTGFEAIGEYIDSFKKLDGVEIIRYEEKIRKAKEDSEEIFKNEFLAKMKESIENAQIEFQNLQKALKNISYGEDTYQFKISANKQKKELYDMILSDSNLGTDSLFTSDFEAKYKEQIAELFDKLRAKDSTESVVREYTDYRNYLDYDIEIHKHSSDGKETVQKLSNTIRLNSGGEGQVPFYVIMAASLNNIYKNGNSVRLMLMDEAFDRMDEQRISSMMDLFKTLDFQVVLFAPTQKIQDIAEKIDTVLTVIREGRSSFVEDFNFYE